MIIDSLGLPKEMGATDLQDSARLAGLCVAFEFKDFDLTKYILKAGEEIPLRDNPEMKISFDKDIYVRHPREYKFDLSRDQARCLMTGLWAMGRADLVDLKYVNGKDIMPPSVTGQVNLIKGKPITCLQKRAMIADVWWHFTFTPLDEPCQLLSMIFVADKVAKLGLLEYWITNNIHWEYSIRRYFYQGDGSWRGEPEFAEHMIEHVKKMRKS